MKLIKKQIVILLVFSFFVSIGAIIHGIFFDLDFSEIKRLTIGGIFATFFVLFPTLLFLEWAFDLNNQKQIDDLRKRIEALEKKES